MCSPSSGARRRGRHRAVLAVQREVVSGVADRARLRVVDLLEEAALDEARVVEGLGDGRDRRAEHAVLLAGLANLALRAGERPWEQVRGELVDALRVERHARYAPLRLLQQVLDAEHAEEPGDLRRQSAGQRHEAIGARIRAHANAPRERTALREAAGVLVGLQPR